MFLKKLKDLRLKDLKRVKAKPLLNLFEKQKTNIKRRMPVRTEIKGEGVLFNLTYGQQRGKPGTPGKMYHRACSPKKALIFASLRVGGQPVRYNADRLGNIEVFAPAHLQSMVQLGWPIYDGDGRSIRPDDLIWPNHGLHDDPYMQRIIQTIGGKVGV